MHTPLYFSCINTSLSIDRLKYPKPVHHLLLSIPRNLHIPTFKISTLSTIFAGSN